MKQQQKLAHPFFIVAILLLVLNDWVFKQTFANGLTGKLSDFAGLFAFPFFFAVFFPRNKISIYIVTCLAFLIWKSPSAEPFITLLNDLGVPAKRVVDLSDYWALLALPFSFYTLGTVHSFTLKPVILNLLACLSLLSFCATSMPPGTYTSFNSVNKTYNFSFSKRELVSRINTLQLEYIRDIDKYAHYTNNGLQFDSKTNMFYYINPYRKGKRDTVARILDFESIKDTDTIKLVTSYARIAISGDSSTSTLRLIELSRYVRKAEKGDHLLKSTALFEKYVVRKLNRYGK